MDANKIGRLYKGEEYDIDITIPYSGETFESFQLSFFTDSASTFVVPFAQLRAEGSTIKVNIQENDFDILADGVLRYYMEYTVNGITTILSTNTMHYLKTPDGYSGMTSQDIYNQGYNDGIEAAGGDYTEGYNAGIDYQKGKMISIEITENGTYVHSDGYSAVTVDVPQQTFNGQEKNYTITSNGETTIRPDLGYDGITGGTITVNTPGYSEEEMEESFESGYTEGYDEGFASGETQGYTEGYDSGSTDGYNTGYETGYTEGFASGETHGYNEGYESGNTDGYHSGYDIGVADGAESQKALLVSTAITENGLYEREDGYNSVNVSIPQTGHTDQEMEASYNSGYTDGYSSGNTDGYATGYTEGYTSGNTDGYQTGYETGYTQGYTSGETDGYNTGYSEGYASGDTQGYDSGYTEGYSDGYTSGETNGMAAQKALLVSSAFTANGTYTMENGWNEVTVDVPTVTPYKYAQHIVEENGSNFYHTTIRFSASTQYNGSGYDIAIYGTWPSPERVYLYEIYAEDDEVVDTHSYITIYVNGGSLLYDDSEWNAQKYGNPDIIQGMDSTAMTITFDFKERYYSCTIDDWGDPVFAKGEMIVDDIRIITAVPSTGHTDAEITTAYNSGYTGGYNYRESLINPVGVLKNPSFGTIYGFSGGVRSVQVFAGEYNAGAMYIDFNLYFRNYGIDSMLIKGLEGSNDFEEYYISPGMTYYNVQLLTTCNQFVDSMLLANNDYMMQSQGQETLLFEINNVIFYGNSTGFITDLYEIMNLTDYTFKFTNLFPDQFTEYEYPIEMWGMCGSHTAITFNTPIGHFGQFHLPNCTEIRLPNNTRPPVEYFTMITQDLPQNGTLYCKSSIYNEMAASEFWHTFPSGWSISATL